MPRRRTYRRKPKKNSAMKIARSNRAKIARMDQSENKLQTYSLTSQHVNTVGGMTLINGIPKGTDRNERVGNQVGNRRVHIRGVYNNTHGTPEDVVIRMLLIKANSPEGIAPVITDVLTTIDVNAMIDTDNVQDYKVLYDHTFAMDTSVHSRIPFKITKLLNGKTMYNNGDTGLINDIQSNAYYLMWFSDVPGTVDDPLLDVTVRFTYRDD